MRYENTPRKEYVREDVICAETGNIIYEGEYCCYYPVSMKHYSKESHTGRDFFSWAHDVLSIMGSDK